MITVFSQEWFNKYQKPLCWLANSWLGEFVFKFNKFGHNLDPKKLIVKITPNSVAQFNRFVGTDVELTEQFFIRNEYALRLQKVFYPIWITFHTWDIITRPIPQLNLGFDTLTVYTWSIGEQNPIDGYATRSDSGTWSQIRDGAGTYKNDYNSAANVWQLACSAAAYTSVYRSIFCFDTSSLTSGATISAATFSLYGTSKTSTWTYAEDGAANVYGATPASTTALETADYGRTGSTAFCDTAITYSSWSTSGYNDFSLNASGLANISKTSISKFAGRDATHDVADSAPTNPGTGNISTNVQSNFGAAASNKPKLVVTYTAAATGPANLKSYNTNLKANIKTINTNAIANVKSLNTNT